MSGAGAPSPAPAAEAGAPRDVDIAMPSGWWPIDLDPERTERSVAAILERQFRGRDDLPHVKADLRRALLRRAERARANGGVQLWLCLELAGPLPLPASLLVTVVGQSGPGPDGGESLLGVLHAARTERGEDVHLVEIELGTALRTRRDVPLVDPADPIKDRDIDTGDTFAATLDYHVAIPGTDRLLLLTFSTPLPVPALVDAFVDLFDAIAEGARWVR